MTSEHISASRVIPADPQELFDLAGEKCYVARSLSEPVAHSVEVRAVTGA